MAASQTSSIRQVVRWHRPLMLFTGAMALLALAAAAGVLIDDRVLGGQPIWLKPFKFAASFVIYGTTLAWLLSLLRRRRRRGWWMGTVIVAAGAVEMIAIVGQVVRGRHSHFNVATPFDTATWAVMAGTIAVLWLANLVIAALLLRERIGDQAATWAVRLGIAVAVVGMALGFLMTSPTSDQVDALAAGEGSDLVGAHTVGVPDGGPGMPVTGWSTIGGDLRIPHFVGMHGLQAVPLLALALAALAARLPGLRDERVRASLVKLGAAAYAGLVALVTWQALRGQPLIHPDAATLTALTLLLGATAAGAVAVARTGGTRATAAAPPATDETER